MKDETGSYAFCAEPKFDNLFFHGGAAVGASSAVVIEPENDMVIALLVNLDGINASVMAIELAKHLTKHIESKQTKYV